MTRFRFSIYCIVAILLLPVAILFVVHRYNYPYGERPACMPVLLATSRSYSLDHGGYFPNSGDNPLESLSLLYSRYLPDGEPIAGLTGDKKLLKRQLSKGVKIDETASSWVYWPGFKSEDDPDLAMVWERQSGVQFNGSRGHGREAGFADGSMRQIADRDWSEFLTHQKQIRQRILTTR
jgi:hypothetical protein